jgi:hypothetical protein
VAANLRLVESVARKFHGRGLSHWELCQEGAFGLLKSTEKFDGNRRTKFSSYAFFWIQEVGAFPFRVFIAQCFPKLWESFVSMPLSLGVCLFRDEAKWNEAYPHKLIAAWMRVLNFSCCYYIS